MNTEEYGRMYAAEGSHWWYRALHAHVRDACARYAPGARRVADVGCGTGAMAAQLATVADVVGLDFSREGLAYCRRRGLTRLARGDAGHLPLAPGAFDVVLLLDVLYHRNVGDPQAVLGEVHRVLAPGGVVVINVPAYAWLHSSHDIAVHTGRRFTRGEVCGLLRAAGFAVCFASYWNTLFFPAIVLLRVYRRWVPPQGSDVSETTSPAVNRVLGGAMACERALMRVVPLPFGVSVFVVARKGAE